jgi:chemotaxis response regulator CheB
MRVLLTNLPPLLNDILSEALAGESDIEIVRGMANRDVQSLATELSPDVIILQSSRENSEAIARTIRGTTVVAIDATGEHALVFGVGEKPVLLADVSPTTIIMAIRGTT